MTHRRGAEVAERKNFFVCRLTPTNKNPQPLRGRVTFSNRGKRKKTLAFPPHGGLDFTNAGYCRHW
jgi:hypothetical protein